MSLWKDLGTYREARKSNYEQAMRELRQSVYADVAARNQKAEDARAAEGQGWMRDIAARRQAEDRARIHVEQAHQVIAQQERQREWDAQAEAQKNISAVWNRLKDPVIMGQMEQQKGAELSIALAKKPDKERSRDLDGNEIPWWEEMSEADRTSVVRKAIIQDQLDAAVKKGDAPTAHAIKGFLDQYVAQTRQQRGLQQQANQGLVSQQELQQAGIKTTTTPRPVGPWSTPDPRQMAQGGVAGIADWTQLKQYVPETVAAKLPSTTSDYWEANELGEVGTMGFDAKALPKLLDIIGEVTIPGVVTGRSGQEELKRAGRMIAAGVGSTIENLGGVMLAKDMDGSSWIKAGRNIREKALKGVEPAQGWIQEISDSTFQSAPFMVGMMALTLGGMAALPLIGAGAIATWIYGSILGGTFKRTYESLMEAGGTYIESRRRGDSHAEGQKAFNTDMSLNQWLLGMDVAEVAVMFAPVPPGLKVIGNPILRTVVIGGKPVVVGLSEGGEELWQAYAQKKALGDPWAWNPKEWDHDTWLAVATGFTMGAGMGGGGAVSDVAGMVKAQQDNRIVALYTKAHDKAIAEGKDEVTAELQGIIAVSEDKQGAKVIEQIVEQSTPQVSEATPTTEQPPSVEKQGTEGNPAASLWTRTRKWADKYKNDNKYVVYFKEGDTDRGYARIIDDHFTEMPEDMQEQWLRRPRFKDWETNESLSVAEDGVRGTAVHDLVEEAALNTFESATQQPITQEGTTVTPQASPQVAARTMAAETPKDDVASLRVEIENYRKTPLEKRTEATKAIVSHIKERLTAMKGVIGYTDTKRLLTQVSQARGEKSLTKAIQAVDEVLENVQRKRTLATIQKEVARTKPTKTQAGYKVGKLTPESQRVMDSVRSQLKATVAQAAADLETAQGKILSNIMAVQDGSMSYEDMVAENEVLSMVGLNAMSQEQLDAALANIKSIKETGQTLRAQERFNESEKHRVMREKVIEVVTGKKGLAEGTETMGSRYATKQTSVLDKLVVQQMGLDSLMDLLDSKDSTTTQYQGYMHKTFAGLVHRMRRAQVAGSFDAEASITQGAMEAYGVKSAGELESILTDLKNTEIAWHGSKKATKAQLLQKYMEMKAPELDSTFRDTMGFTDEMFDAVKKSLSAQDKAFADWIQANIYGGEYAESIAAVFSQDFHMDMPRHENYAPLNRDVDGPKREESLLLADVMRYASARNSHLKNRVKNKKALLWTDALSVLMNHTVQMEHYKAFATAMKDVRAVFQNAEVRTAIRQNYGNDVLQAVDSQFDDIARDSMEVVKALRWYDKVASTLRKNFTWSILGAKPAIMLKQVPSILAYTTEVGFGDFMHGVSDFWAHPIDNYRYMYANSALMRERFAKGFERDVRFVMQKDATKVLAQHGNFKDWFMTLIRNGDKFAVTQGMWAAYRSALKQGKTEAEAILFAEEVTQRTQPTHDIETLAGVQRGSPSWKLFTMFQNQKNKYFRMMIDNARNLRAGRQSPQKALYNFVLVWCVLPMWFQFIADAFRFKPENQARAALMGQFNSILVFGQMLDALVNKAMGIPWGYEGTPVVSIAQEAEYTVSKLKTILTDWADPTKKIDTDDVILAIEHFAQFAGGVSGFPTPYGVQAERAIREGEPEQLIFSEYALTGGAKAKAPAQVNVRY